MAYVELQRTIASDNGLLGIAVAGVGRWFRLIFIVAEVMGHSGIERRLDADFLQQAIELVEILRGFKVFGQFVSQSLQLFSSINQPSFDVELNISKSGNYTNYVQAQV